MEQKKLSRTELSKIGSRELAYLGDSVYEVNIRKQLIRSGILSVKRLNEESSRYVSALGQADIFNSIEKFLTEEEKVIAKRGRNTKIKHPSKSVDIMTYRIATGLECLFGYLSITDNEQRIKELIDLIFEKF